MKKKQQGFTLVELLIAAMMLLVLTGVSLTVWILFCLISNLG